MPEPASREEKEEEEADGERDGWREREGGKDGGSLWFLSRSQARPIGGI